MVKFRYFFAGMVVALNFPLFVQKHDNADYGVHTWSHPIIYIVKPVFYFGFLMLSNVEKGGDRFILKN